MWLLLPVSGLLVALIGVLIPPFWKTPAAPVEQTAREGPSASCALPSPIPDRASRENSEEQRVQQAMQEKHEQAQPKQPFTYRSLWPFTPGEKQQNCTRLTQLENEGDLKKTADRCNRYYSPWIAYLSLETSSSPACNLERAFGIATEAIARGRLCGRGYAFLSIYYSYKRVLDRSRSFLEEALHASPKDPWVKLVEAVVYMREFRDNEKAAQLLNNLIRKEPSFALAQYHLARIYIEEEEYGKAEGLFSHLEKAFPQQHGFKDIQQSLAGIEHLPYYSAEKARGLLEISRALAGLMDYPLAGLLCHTVLEDMPNTLPRAQKKSALYDLGRISELRGDRETAFTCYQNALRIDPSYRDVRERIGHILKGTEQTS